MVVLLGHGTEDFSNELGVTPDGRGVHDDPGSSHSIFLVGERRPLAGSSLDGDSVASPRKLVHCVRREGNPTFAGRQLAHQADPHRTLSKRSSSTTLKGYPEGGRRSNRAPTRVRTKESFQHPSRALGPNRNVGAGSWYPGGAGTYGQAAV